MTKKIMTTINEGISLAVKLFSTEELAMAFLSGGFDDISRLIVGGELFRRKKALYEEICGAWELGFLSDLDGTFIRACANPEIERKIMNFEFRRFAELLKELPTEQKENMQQEET